MSDVRDVIARLRELRAATEQAPPGKGREIALRSFYSAAEIALPALLDVAEAALEFPPGCSSHSARLSWCGECCHYAHGRSALTAALDALAKVTP